MKFRWAVLASALLVVVSACSSAPKQSAADRLQHYSDSHATAALMLQQFEIDTGWISLDQLRALNCVDPDGTLRACNSFRVWFSLRGNYVIGPGSHVAGDDAEDHMAALMHHLVALSPEQVAHALLIQELVDAGYLHAQDFGADGDGVVAPGPTVDRWIGAHGSQLLCQGARADVGVESERVLAAMVDAGSARLE